MILLFFASASSRADCQYSFDPSAVQIGWTAYKTTAKVPVNGQFKTFNVQGPVTGSDIPTLLNALDADIATDSVATGNPTRDGNILAGFFKFVKGFNVHGRFRNAVGSAQDGTVELALTINGRWGVVPMNYAIGADSKFTATGTLDLLKFGLGAALTQMNTVCGDYHTGADGVSKTWSTVDLTLAVPVTSTCSH